MSWIALRAALIALVLLAGTWGLAHAAGAPATPKPVRAALADTLGKGAIDAADRDAEASLAALARWRAASALDDSALARGRARIDAIAADLAGTRPTELAVSMTLDGRARPQKVLVSIDGIPAAIANYGDADWRALDSGAWAEVARRTTRSGRREVRIDLEDANHRNQSVRWVGPLEAGRLSVLRLRVPAAGAPTLDFVAATAP